MSKVLIIEENSPQSKGLASALNERGLEVRTASEGHDGFEEILDFRPDAVLMNLNLPELSGLDILRGIRPHRRQVPLKFIAYGFEDKAREQKAMRAGADRVLGKKPDNENVLEAVQEVLSELEEDRRMHKYAEATRKKLFADEVATEDDASPLDAQSEEINGDSEIPSQEQQTPGEAQPEPEAEEQSATPPAGDPGGERPDHPEPALTGQELKPAGNEPVENQPVENEPVDPIAAQAQPATPEHTPSADELPAIPPQAQPQGEDEREPEGDEKKAPPPEPEYDEQESIQTKRMAHPTPPRKAPQFQKVNQPEDPAPHTEAEPEDSKQPVPQQDTQPEEQTLETAMPESDNPSPEQEHSTGQDLPKPPPNPQQRQVGGAGGQGADTNRLLSKPPRITTSFKTTPIVPRKRPRDTSTFRPSMLPSAKPPKNLGAVKSVGSGILPPAPGSSGSKPASGAPSLPATNRPQGQRPVRSEEEQAEQKAKTRTGRIQLPTGRLGQGSETQPEQPPTESAESTTQSGQEIPEAVSINIQSALSALPEVDYGALPDQVNVAVPLDEVREQLKQGRVVLSAARLRELGGQNLQAILENVEDEEEIHLPLQEIVSQLPPEALALRPDQQVKGRVEDEEISKFRFEEAFGIKPEGETPAAPEPEADQAPPQAAGEPSQEQTPEAEETARPAAGDKVSISVRSMAEQFPGFMDEDIPEDLRIDVPLEIVRHQLSRGRVSLTQDQARELLPADQHHLLQELDEDQEINLPLRDVVEAIPPDQLSSSGPRQTQTIPQVTSEPLFREYKGQDAPEEPESPEAEVQPEPEAEQQSAAEPAAQQAPAPEPPQPPQQTGVSGDPVPPPLPPEALEQEKKGKGRPRPPLPFQRLTNIIVPRRKGSSSDVDSEPAEEEKVEPLPKIPVAAPPKPKPASESTAPQEPAQEEPPSAEAPKPVGDEQASQPLPPLPAAAPVKPLRESGSGMIHDDLMRTAKISLPSGGKGGAKRSSGRVISGPETRVSGAGRMEKIRLKLPDVLKANLEDTPENREEISQVPDDIEIVLPAPVVHENPQGGGWIISVRDFLDFVPDDYQKLFIIGYGSDEVVLPAQPAETEHAAAPQPDAAEAGEAPEAAAPEQSPEVQEPVAQEQEAVAEQQEPQEPVAEEPEAEAEQPEDDQQEKQVPAPPSFRKPETKDALRLKSLLSRRAGQESDEESEQPQSWKVPPVPKRPAPPKAMPEEEEEIAAQAEEPQEAEEAPVSRAEPQAVSDAAQPSTEEETQPQPEPVDEQPEPEEEALEPEPEPLAAEATSSEAGEDEEDAELSEGTLALSLPPILEANFGSCPESITADDRVVVPLNTVRSQLSRGRVTLPLEEFLQYLSPLHQQAVSDLGEAEEIKLPLQEIFKTLPPDALKVETPQQTVPIDKNVQTPFLELARQEQAGQSAPEDAEPEEEVTEEPRKLKLRSAPVPPLPKVQGKQEAQEAEEEPEAEPVTDEQQDEEGEIKPPGPMPDYIQDATRTVRFGMTPMPRFRPAVTPNMESELSREKEQEEKEQEDHPARDLLAEVRKAPMFHRKAERSEEDLEPGATAPEPGLQEPVEAKAPETEPQPELEPEPDAEPQEEPVAEEAAEPATQEPEAEEPEAEAQPSLPGLKPLVLPKARREEADLEPGEEPAAATDDEQPEPAETQEESAQAAEPVEAEAAVEPEEPVEAEAPSEAEEAGETAEPEEPVESEELAEPVKSEAETEADAEADESAELEEAQAEGQDEAEPEIGLATVSQSILLQTQLGEEDLPTEEDQEEPAEEKAEQDLEPAEEEEPAVAEVGDEGEAELEPSMTELEAEPEPKPSPAAEEAEPEPVSAEQQPEETPEPIVEPELQQALSEIEEPDKAEAVAESEPVGAESIVTETEPEDEPEVEEAAAAASTEPVTADALEQESTETPAEPEEPAAEQEEETEAPIGEVPEQSVIAPEVAPAAPVRRKFDPSRVQPAPSRVDLSQVAQYSMWMEDPFIDSQSEPAAEAETAGKSEPAVEPETEQAEPIADVQEPEVAEIPEAEDQEQPAQPESSEPETLESSVTDEPETDEGEEDEEFLAYQEETLPAPVEELAEEEQTPAPSPDTEAELAANAEDDEDEFAAYMPDFSLRRPDLPEADSDAEAKADAEAEAEADTGSEAEAEAEPELELTSGMAADLTMLPQDEEAQESTVGEPEQESDPVPGSAAAEVHTEDALEFQGESPESIDFATVSEDAEAETTQEPAEDLEPADRPQIREVPGAEEDEETIEPSRPTSGEPRVPEVEAGLSASLAGEMPEQQESPEAEDAQEPEPAEDEAQTEKESQPDKLSTLLNRLVAHQDDEEEREELAEAVAEAAEQRDPEAASPQISSAEEKAGATLARGRILMPLSRLTSVLPTEIQSLLEDEKLDFEVALPIENLIQAREQTDEPAEQAPSFESLKKFFAGITRKEDSLTQVSRAEAVTTVALTFATLIENVSVETVERYFDKVPGTTIVEIPSQLIAQQTEGPLFFLTGSQLTSLLPQELRGEVHVGDHVRLEVPLTEVVNDLPRQILAQLLDSQLRHRQEQEMAEQNEVERESEPPAIPPRPQDLEDRRRTTPRF